MFNVTKTERSTDITSQLSNLHFGRRRVFCPTVQCARKLLLLPACMFCLLDFCRADVHSRSMQRRTVHFLLQWVSASETYHMELKGQYSYTMYDMCAHGPREGQQHGRKQAHVKFYKIVTAEVGSELFGHRDGGTCGGEGGPGSEAGGCGRLVHSLVLYTVYWYQSATPLAKHHLHRCVPYGLCESL